VDARTPVSPGLFPINKPKNNRELIDSCIPNLITIEDYENLCAELFNRIKNLPEIPINEDFEEKKDE
jgi:hypothetical protein